VDITESHRYKNTEEEFKSSIHKRLVNLLENCNKIENYDVNSGDTLKIEEKLEIYQVMKIEFKSSGNI
jgi:ribosomal protein S10